MKSLIALCALLCLISLTPALAGENELTFSGSYVRHENDDSAWAASGEYGIAAGHLRLGPAFAITEGEGQVNDRLLAGGIAHLNLGDEEGGLFVGARGLYDFDAEEGTDDYQVSVRAGLNMFKGRALFRAYLEQVVAGFEETGDLTANAGFGLRF